MQELFISYCRHDFDTANALADKLFKAGLSVWLDRKAIEEGAAFDTQIEEAIAQTRVVIVIWSEHSVKSHWVRAEAAYALGKRKLLPISIDQSEPPLQFMQIQTIDFRYWDRTSNHHAFQQLAAALAKRLEASAASSDAQPRSVSHTLAALRADALKHPAKKRLEAWIAAAGLRFPETIVEEQYQDYFCEKTFIIAQFAMLLAAATYVVYGAADMAMESGGVLSTRFRFMIALPLMATFFALSFRPFARRHSQAFIIAFGVVAMACTYMNVYLIAVDSPFRVDNGNATMNAMLMLGFLALLPLSVSSTILLGSIVVAVHAGVVMESGMLLWTSWLFHLHVGSMFTVACCIAYWRERFHRIVFAASIDSDHGASAWSSPASLTEDGWTDPVRWAERPAAA
jgi:TIR domain